MVRVLPKSFDAANIIGLAKIRRTVEKLGANIHGKNYQQNTNKSNSSIH